MGKRKKRRKRRRAEERAEQARSGDLNALAAEDAQYEEDDGDDEEEESSGSRFGFGRFRQSKPDDTPEYDDKPWWSEEEDYELSDYERKQYGKYEKMPPPLAPEHLRVPETKKDEEPSASPIGQVAAVTTHEVGKVVERVKKIDWELVQVRISEVTDKIKAGGKRVVEEIQFRNLEMREKVPPKFHIPIYAAIAVIVIGIPLSIIVLMFAGRGANPETEIAVQITQVPQNNASSIAPTETAIPELIIPTLAQPTAAPLPSNTPIPPTAIPPTIPPPTDMPIAQPTTAPIVVESAGIAPFFAPGVQYWVADLDRWAQAFGIEANYLAIVMQLETCGNPQFIGTEGRVGLFAVPLDRFQEGEAFADPDINALRAAELIMQCQALTGNDPGQTYTCYRSNTDTTQVDFGSWSEAMQKRFLWSLGMYGDTQINALESAALNDWLVTGGGLDVCTQAHSVQDNR